MASSSEKTEKTPLLDPTEKEISENIHQIYASYGLDSHATFVRPPHAKADYLVDYEPRKFSSFRVFFLSRGTILKDPVLLTEQLIITIIFASCAIPVYFWFKSAMDNEARVFKTDPNVSLRHWLADQESKMRAFAMIMTTLAAFLLSFYTSMAVTRWWAMRTSGIGGIKAATVDLELLLYQNVTQEEQVLGAVRRYGRASLMLIFLWRQHSLDKMTDELTKYDLLTNHECEQLLKWNHCLHETIWAWQSGIVAMLHKEGKIKSDQLYSLLLSKCTEGRAAVQCVHTHLAVRIPMQYVHLLGLLVKMHNLVLAVIMGLLFGAALRNGEIIICVQLFGRTLILPFLFNAILLINAELADPFDGNESDFPGPIYQAAIEKDSAGMISATQNMPDWLMKRYDHV